MGLVALVAALKPSLLSSFFFGRGASAARLNGIAAQTGLDFIDSAHTLCVSGGPMAHWRKKRIFAFFNRADYISNGGK